MPPIGGVVSLPPAPPLSIDTVDEIDGEINIPLITRGTYDGTSIGAI